ncbi:hypothetical protein [Virgibacillus sediminis]|uniref:Uncharacterized protein n=1 Tax=Virgibacillus sediminis TaxID=202260 RepID=A0ABV7A3D3_9BACI
MHLQRSGVAGSPEMQSVPTSSPSARLNGFYQSHYSWPGALQMCTCYQSGLSDSL